jgi:hypothetical protein
VIATVVETKQLLETVIASIVAGVGVTATFSIMILGVARFAEHRRDERPVAAAVFGAIAVLSLLVTVGAIVLGMVVMLSKD